MKIESMREFLVFAKHRNFSAAARELYITQPAMSMRIAAMEKELGFKLVDRNRGADLTPAGREFFAGCRVIVDEYDRIMKACKVALDGQPPVRLRVSGTPNWLPLLLRDAQDVLVDLVEVPIDKYFPLEELVRDIVDVSVIWDYASVPAVATYAEQHGIACERIGTDRLCLCVSRDGMFGGASELKRVDLFGCTVLIPYNKWYEAMIQWSKEILGEDLNLRFRMVDTSSIFEQQYLEMGDAVVIGNETVALLQTRDDVVAFDGLDGMPIEIDLMAVYRKADRSAKAGDLVKRAAKSSGIQ